MKLEPAAQIEFMLQNKQQDDPKFCSKIIDLKNDVCFVFLFLNNYFKCYNQSTCLSIRKIRYKLIDLKVKNTNFALQLQKRISSKWLIQTNETSAAFNSGQHLVTPSFLKHAIVVVSLIVGTFLILILLIGMIVVIQTN